MSKSRVRLNDRGLRQMMRQVQEDIEAADRQFRETHVGLPVNVIVADFGEYGPNVELPEATLHAYARAVSTGEPFGWHLTA